MNVNTKQCFIYPEPLQAVKHSRSSWAQETAQNSPDELLQSQVTRTFSPPRSKFRLQDAYKPLTGRLHYVNNTAYRLKAARQKKWLLRILADLFDPLTQPYQINHKSPIVFDFSGGR